MSFIWFELLTSPTPNSPGYCGKRTVEISNYAGTQNTQNPNPTHDVVSGQSQLLADKGTNIYIFLIDLQVIHIYLFLVPAWFEIASVRCPFRMLARELCYTISGTILGASQGYEQNVTMVSFWCPGQWTQARYCTFPSDGRLYCASGEGKQPYWYARTRNLPCSEWAPIRTECGISWFWAQAVVGHFTTYPRLRPPLLYKLRTYDTSVFTVHRWFLSYNVSFQ